MSTITPLPVLAHVVSLVKNVISDLKIEYTTTASAVLKDGNDTIHLDQRFDSTGKFATVLINDQRDILFSEDLLPELVELQNATIVVNDLDVETRLVLETVKDAFDQLSSSYEFVKTTTKELTNVKSEFKFENHRFEVILNNEPTKLLVGAEFASNVDSAIKKIIETDTFKVQKAVDAIFKKA